MLSIDISPNLGTDKVLGIIKDSIDETVEVALDKSAAAILNRLRTTYLAEQDPTGAPWLPSFAGIKRRAKGGTGTMFDTGTLFRSIQLTKSGEGFRVIGTDVPYGVKHQFGLEGMEKREFLTVTPEHEKIAASIFQNELAAAIRSKL